MKKKTAILLAGTMIASTILAGCGSKEEGAANQVASEEILHFGILLHKDQDWK